MSQPVGVRCPKCGSEIVYNGNYFCSRWEYPYTGDGCDWALSHNDRNGEPIGARDKRVWEEIKFTAWFVEATTGLIVDDT